MSLTKHSPALGKVAGGNSLSAQNDEPEFESWPMPAPFNWHESVYAEAERRVQEVMRQPLANDQGDERG